MPYTINKYSGSQITVVNDGTIDTTLDLKLIGKNSAGYGEVQNENFVFLLENFAGLSAPPKKITGQIWFDSANSKLKFFDGNKFRTTGGAEIGATEPSGLTEGDFWFNTASRQLYAWSLTGSANGTSPGFILVGPQGVSGAGTTEMKSVSVNGRPVGNPSGSLTQHIIIKAIINDVVVYIISQDADFDLDSTNPITGFTTIHQGMTLCYTNNTNLPGQTTSSHRFWGTASNAEKLGGYSASDYSRSSNAVFGSTVAFADVGYTIGISPRLLVFNENALTPTFRNQLSDTIAFQTTVTAGGTTIKTPLKLIGTDVVPGADGVSNIGSLTAGAGSTPLKYNYVYANYFKGQADSSSTLLVSSVARSADTASSPNTIAARTSLGELNASQFNGLATSAQYADLAEKYLADAEYEAGTVMVVGGEKEVTASGYGQNPIGVVSSNPAFKMNSELEGGTYVALKGRVPVKVEYPVSKGDFLVAGHYGCARVATDPELRHFAVALESSDDPGVKLIECVVL
jgi:hypothetical protein